MKGSKEEIITMLYLITKFGVLHSLSCCLPAFKRGFSRFENQINNNNII